MEKKLVCTHCKRLKTCKKTAEGDWMCPDGHVVEVSPSPLDIVKVVGLSGLVIVVPIVAGMLVMGLGDVVVGKHHTTEWESMQ